MPISSQLWNLLPVSFIQFPFRLLSVTLICIAYLSACSISAWKGNKKYIISVALVIIVLVSMLPFLKSGKVIENNEGNYSTNMATTTVMDEYMPIWVKEKALKIPDKKAEILNGKGIIQNILSNSHKISFNLNLESRSIIRINTIYYPGWQVRVDGISVPITYNNKYGVMEFSVPAGNHIVQAIFGETRERLAADMISLISFFILILLVFRKSIFKLKKLP